MDSEITLRIKGISKTFPGVRALNKVDLEIRKGEVHALVGENGAGKSTLMNILSGNYKLDEGEIFLNGQEVRIEDQKHAQALGISIVYQDRSLVDNLSIAENIFAGRQPLNRLGLIDTKKLNAMTNQFLKDLNLHNFNSKTLVGDLSPAMQQMVEIAKALSQNPKILILDEPTATITEAEIDVLFNIVRELSEKGVSVIYISHRLSEIFEIADCVSVLKDGDYQGTKEVKDTNVDDIIQMMVGRKLVKQEFNTFAREGVALEVKNLSGQRFRNMNFQLRRGEIVSLVGLAGAGRTETAMAIFGADPKTSGEVYVFGEKVDIKNPTDAIRHGIGYLPEDRKQQGLFLEMSIEANIISGNLKNAVRKNSIFINEKKITDTANLYKDKLRIATPSIKRNVINLSGGNQQKVIVAKWLMVNPKILIVDEPTRGIDVGSKEEIYAILKNLASAGTAILMISSELPEALALSDRIIVMWNGKMTGELSCRDLEPVTEEMIMKFASGLNN